MKIGVTRFITGSYDMSNVMSLGDKSIKMYETIAIANKSISRNRQLHLFTFEMRIVASFQFSINLPAAKSVKITKIFLSILNH